MNPQVNQAAKTLDPADRNMAPSKSLHPDMSVVPIGRSWFARKACANEATINAAQRPSIPKTKQNTCLEATRFSTTGDPDWRPKCHEQFCSQEFPTRHPDETQLTAYLGR